MYYNLLKTFNNICVILGWELNILESVVVTLAIGLSVDFKMFNSQPEIKHLNILHLTKKILAVVCLSKKRNLLFLQ